MTGGTYVATYQGPLNEVAVNQIPFSTA